MLDITSQKIAELAKEIAQDALTADGPPEAGPQSAQSFRAAIAAAEAHLPHQYLQSFARPLSENADRLAQDPYVQFAETMVGAVSQHAADSVVQAQVRRFVVVVADFYRSFLGDIKRERLNIPLTEKLAPLASFRDKADMGPFTITTETVNAFMGSAVAVVSLPSAYRNHPVIWGTLAHETGGHDVIHADPPLLGELQEGVYGEIAGEPMAPFAAKPSDDELRGLLWSYWMNEASADVYGIMNMGPAFLLGSLPFLSAMLSQIPSLGITTPFVRTSSSSSGDHQMLDSHPTDILRIGMAEGIIDSLTSLSDQTRSEYLSLLDDVAKLVADGATKVRLSGMINVPHQGTSIHADVSGEYDLDEMQGVARKVGAWLATAKFLSLAGRSIQDLETWSDHDESQARKLAQRMVDGQAIAGLANPMLLLAGATLAVASQPKKYDAVGRLLEDALDKAFASDPTWGQTISRRPLG